MTFNDVNDPRGTVTLSTMENIVFYVNVFMLQFIVPLNRCNCIVISLGIFVAF